MSAVSETNRWRVEGPMTFSTVKALHAQGEHFITQHQACVIDLTEVVHAETCGIALLIAWLRFARQSGVALTFENPPKQTEDLAAVHGVAKLLFP